MRKIFLLLVFIAIAIGNTFAYDFEVDGIYYNMLSENTVEVTYGENKSYSESITIPSSITIKGIIYSVTSIGNFAFKDCNKLTSITIPSSVNSIGYRSFYGCYSLISITIPEGCTSIGDYAFFECSGLTSITIPNGITSIGNYTFAGCDGLTSITITDEVTSIGYRAFSSCTSLTSVSLGNGVSSIGDYAFSECICLKSITIPDGATSLGNCAFYKCKSLESITIPDGVSWIGWNAFEGCSSLTSINIPQGVNLIGNHTFGSCHNLVSITIPDGLTSILSYAFDYCYQLKEINISNVENWMKIEFGENAFYSYYDIIVKGLKLTDLIVPESIGTIGGYTFYKCTSLESITLHKNLTTILKNAFNGCTNVKSIICQGETPPVVGANALDDISRTECSLHVPNTSLDLYKSTFPWNEFSNIIGEETGIQQVTSNEDITISTDGNTININGTIGGETIEVYPKFRSLVHVLSCCSLTS